MSDNTIDIVNLNQGQSVDITVRNYINIFFRTETISATKGGSNAFFAGTSEQKIYKLNIQEHEVIKKLVFIMYDKSEFVSLAECNGYIATGKIKSKTASVTSLASIDIYDDSKTYIKEINVGGNRILSMALHGDKVAALSEYDNREGAVLTICNWRNEEIIFTETLSNTKVGDLQFHKDGKFLLFQDITSIIAKYDDEEQEKISLEVEKSENEVKYLKINDFLTLIVTKQRQSMIAAFDGDDVICFKDKQFTTWSIKQVP